MGTVYNIRGTKIVDFIQAGYGYVRDAITQYNWCTVAGVEESPPVEAARFDNPTAGTAERYGIKWTYTGVYTPAPPPGGPD